MRSSVEVRYGEIMNNFLITMLNAIQRKPLVRQVKLTTGQIKENTLKQRVAMGSTDTCHV